MNELPPNRPLREMIQVDSVTGVSHDYANEFQWAFMQGAPEGFLESTLAQRVASGRPPMRRYEEVYPADTYANVVNDQNRETVAKLDAIADEVEALQQSGRLNIETFKQKALQAAEIIYGAALPKGYRL